MANAQKKKAEDFISQAEKLSSKRSWFGGGSNNKEEAAELYLQAANAYKVGGLQCEAGNVYVKAAELYQNTCGQPNDAAKAFGNAGEYMTVMTCVFCILLFSLSHSQHYLSKITTASCFKKGHAAADAVAAFQSAVALLTDAARLTQAAKLLKECAELYENEEVELADTEKSNVVLAIETYERAAELFTLEDSKSQASQCQAKVAELCSVALEPTPDLLRAAGIYEELGRNCLDSNLLKYNAKAYFLQAILCHLAAGDAVAATEALQRYESLDYTFGESREGKFASQLTECVEGMDAEGLGTVCFEYDRISKLDPWKTTMLVRVKRSIGGENGGGEDDDEFDLT